MTFCNVLRNFFFFNCRYDSGPFEKEDNTGKNCTEGFFDMCSPELSAYVTSRLNWIILLAKPLHSFEKKGWIIFLYRRSPFQKLHRDETHDNIRSESDSPKLSICFTSSRSLLIIPKQPMHHFFCAMPIQISNLKEIPRNVTKHRLLFFPLMYTRLKTFSRKDKEKKIHHSNVDRYCTYNIYLARKKKKASRAKRSEVNNR